MRKASPTLVARSRNTVLAALTAHGESKTAGFGPTLPSADGGRGTLSRKQARVCMKPVSSLCTDRCCSTTSASGYSGRRASSTSACAARRQRLEMCSFDQQIIMSVAAFVTRLLCRLHQLRQYHDDDLSRAQTWPAWAASQSIRVISDSSAVITNVSINVMAPQGLLIDPM